LLCCVVECGVGWWVLGVLFVLLSVLLLGCIMYGVDGLVLCCFLFLGVVCVWALGVGAQLITFANHAPKTHKNTDP